METILLAIGVAALVMIALALCSVASALLGLQAAYRRPPLQPGDRLLVRSFGVENQCFVVDVGADGTVLVAPVPAA